MWKAPLTRIDNPPARYSLLRGMGAVENRSEGDRTGVRVGVFGTGEANVVTGLPVLDHLLSLLAAQAGFDLALEIAPGAAHSEVAAAGRALGTALAGPLRVADARGHGSAALPADEALAHVVLEASGRPLVVSNADLSQAHVGGLGGDLLGQFLHELAGGAGLTLHVRLIEGRETQHVLEAIFKALGVALAQACRPRR
jgi:imidazoleglycerol-phosphate dehydratase